MSAVVKSTKAKIKAMPPAGYKLEQEPSETFVPYTLGELLWGVSVLALAQLLRLQDRGQEAEDGETGCILSFRPNTAQRIFMNALHGTTGDLPLNFHPAATGVRGLFTPIGAG